MLPAIAVACLGLFGLSPLAHAQDWTLESSISQQFLYDDNLLLTPQNKISTFGSRTTPELKLTRESPTSTVSLDAQLPYQNYFGNSDLNSWDQNLDLKAKKELSERSTIGLGANFDRITNLRSATDDTDNFSVNKFRRTDWGASPYWTYLLSPIDTLRLGANYQDVSFDTAQRVDYRSYGPSLGYAHQLSETAQVTGQLYYSRFEPDVPTNRRTNVYGGTLGYRYTPTERFTIGGAAGLSYSVTTEDGLADDDGIGLLANFDVRYEMSERLMARASLSHSTEPSGEGRQTTANRATLSLAYKLTELTSLGFDARYTDNEDYFGTGISSNSGNKKFFSLEPSLRWRVTDDLTLGAQYEYRHKTSDRSGTAVSNAAFITLRYEFPNLSWSGF